MRNFDAIPSRSCFIFDPRNPRTRACNFPQSTASPTRFGNVANWQPAIILSLFSWRPDVQIRCRTLRPPAAWSDILYAANLRFLSLLWHKARLLRGVCFRAAWFNESERYCEKSAARLFRLIRGLSVRQVEHSCFPNDRCRVSARPSPPWS